MRKSLFHWKSWQAKGNENPHLMFPSSRPKSIKQIFRFNQMESVDNWKRYSDQEFGGGSTLDFRLEDGVAVFSGDISLKVPPPQRPVPGHPQKAPTIVRSGFAAVKSPDHDWEFWNGYDTLLINAKSDGSIFTLNVKTTSPVEDALHQVSFSPPEHQFGEIAIPLTDFIATWRGVPESSRYALTPNDILSFGFMMCQRKEGPFKLEIESMWLTDREWRKRELRFERPNDPERREKRERKEMSPGQKLNVGSAVRSAAKPVQNGIIQPKALHIISHIKMNQFNSVSFIDCHCTATGPKEKRKEKENARADVRRLALCGSPCSVETSRRSTGACTEQRELLVSLTVSASVSRSPVPVLGLSFIVDNSVELLDLPLRLLLVVSSSLTRLSRSSISPRKSFVISRWHSLNDPHGSV
ncbi:complex I intermediate-associated protein 30 [Planoprotostelium fungivorum]|uniref:Complex I intermediate-associated protein 30 n=1 Tax=Planoprotostelium fungivorum TaxID=1890364 RepID=A0A2P6NSH0_9EUKA|nr:complex I intermediate-associated protein 30 [Planoprotostelium fungivorum]